MYIQPCNNNVNMQSRKDWAEFLKRQGQKVFDALPNITLNDTEAKCKIWNKFSEVVSRPMENRLIMGATAILTQPTIDYFNPKVDKDTREVSRNRTMAKILAGTASGILVRGSCQAIVDSLTGIGKPKTRFSRAFLPSDIKFLRSLVKVEAFLKNYKNTISTILAILAMCVTNFVIDAPLTLFLTNHFNAKTKEKKLEKLKEGKE